MTPTMTAQPHQPPSFDGGLAPPPNKTPKSPPKQPKQHNAIKAPPAPSSSGDDGDGRSADKVTYHGMEFIIEHGVELPAIPARAPSEVDLPFRGWFDKMPHGSHMFLPNTFWTEARGVEAEKVTARYVRAKVRNAFNKWKEADPSRADHQLYMYERNETTERAAGFSLFIQVEPQAKAT